MRYSAFQLICLASALAAGLALFWVDGKTELSWRAKPLRYVVPGVPVNFRGQLRWKDPGPGTPGDFSRGEVLFKRAHYEGWKDFRYHFYRDFSLIEQKYVLTRSVDSIDLKKDDPRSVQKMAYILGYQQCRRDINQLLLKYSADDLRQQLAIPRSHRRWPLVAVLLVSFATFWLARIPKRK